MIISKWWWWLDLDSEMKHCFSERTHLELSGNFFENVSSQNVDFDAMKIFNGCSLKESTAELSKPIMDT